MTRQALINLIVSTITSNAQGDVSAADVRAVAEGIASNALLLTEAGDKGKVICTEHHSDRQYYAGELVLKNGLLYRATVDSAGAWDPANFAQVTIGTEPVAFQQWDNTATYAEGDYVEYQGQFYRSLQDNNTGNVPGTSGAASWWAGVSLPSSFGAPYEPNLYVQQGQVLRYDKRLWEAQSDLQTASFPSELTNGLWVEISPDSGGAAEFRGVQNVVSAGEVAACDPNHQYIVHGSMTVSGQFDNQGELIIL